MWLRGYFQARQLLAGFVTLPQLREATIQGEVLLIISPKRTSAIAYGLYPQVRP